MLDREYGQGYPSKQKIANLTAELTITCEDLRDEGVEALLEVRRMFDFLPASNRETPPVIPTADPGDRIEDSLDTLVPDNPNKPYDIVKLIRWAADDSEFLEVHQHYAKNIVVGFARLGGIHRNTFLNSPRVLDGAMRLKAEPRLRFAGQVTGVEGYVESGAMGILAGWFAAQERLGRPLVAPPPETVMTIS